MDSIVRGGPRDVIALAWYQIGFRPRESLVLVGLRGPRRRTGLVIRADLPSPAHRRALAGVLARGLRRSGSGEVVALVVSDAGGGPRAGAGGGSVMPHRDLDRWLRRDLPRHGIRVFDVIAVGPAGYRSYGCREISCCPAEGASLDEVLASEVSARMVVAGRTLLTDERDLIADVRPGAGEGPGVGSDGRTHRPGAGGGEPGGVGEGEDPAAWSGAERARLLTQWRRALDTGAQEVARPAAVLAGLTDLRLRDAVMLTLVPGSGRAAEDLLVGCPPQPAAPVLAGRPDPDLADRGQRLLASLARQAPPGRRAEPLAMLAWLAWWRAQGPRGRLLADAALADRPGHRLATLVSQLLAHGVPPEWVPLDEPAEDRPPVGRSGRGPHSGAGPAE